MVFERSRDEYNPEQDALLEKSKLPEQEIEMTAAAIGTLLDETLTRAGETVEPEYRFDEQIGVSLGSERMIGGRVPLWQFSKIGSREDGEYSLILANPIEAENVFMQYVYTVTLSHKDPFEAYYVCFSINEDGLPSGLGSREFDVDNEDALQLLEKLKEFFTEE